MDSEGTGNSISLDDIRKSVISRRGGVRVRGGRLPPIRIRDITPSSSKKAIAPKIPQRRIKKEKEIPEPHLTTPVHIKDERKDIRKPFSRGRGQRVYIQTEGSFLEQGPAMRLKKETVEPRYDRMPRSSSRMKCAMQSKISLAQIHLLLEGYDAMDAYLDDENEIHPVRLPLIKMEPKSEIKAKILNEEEFKLKIKEEILDDDVKLKIKEEILDDEIKLEIKAEILDDDEEKPKIKMEPEDEDIKTKGNLISPDVKSLKNEAFESKISSLIEAMKLSQEEDIFVLFQLPSCLPFKRYDESSDQTTKTAGSSSKQLEKVENLQDELKSTSLNDMPEGSVGKLQIMKSGRVRLNLGSIDFATTSAMNVGGVAEVVSISLETGNNGNFMILGEIYEKLIMYPILEESEKEIKREGKFV